MAGVRWGAFTCVGWQVTLRDPIWQVTSRSSEIGFPWSYIGLFTFNGRWAYACDLFDLFISTVQYLLWINAVSSSINYIQNNDKTDTAPAEIFLKWHACNLTTNQLSKSLNRKYPNKPMFYVHNICCLLHTTHIANSKTTMKLQLSNGKS